MPPCLGNLTSLRRLDLSDNIFPWNIATSPVVALTSLEILALSNTQFQTPISFSSFANHSKLKVFLLSNDGYTNDLIVETEHPTNWVPTFQLKYLVLENYRVNMPKEGFPTFLYHQTELKLLTLVKTNLVGEFPSWLLKNNTKLNTLALQENNFTGTLQDLPATSNYLELYAPNNNIQGIIPTNISKLIPNLQLLVMKSNSLEGEIPSSLGDLQYLVILDLSLNSLIGEIPENLANVFSLGLLNLTGNCLSGQLFPKVSNASSMVFLSLAGNHFTGDIPTSLLNMQSLKLLDIRDNNITGALPNWIGDMKSLKLLLLSKNHLSGSIPKSICRLKSLGSLDISNNKITGLIPPCFSPPFLKYVNFKGNGLTGMLDQMSTAFTNSSQLRILDVGDNHITGNIPQWIANRLPELRILVLKGNNFGGDIPHKLCHLQKVTLIDLSLNNLSGPIPSCLANLTFNVITSSTERVAYKPYFLRPELLFPGLPGIYDESNNIMRSNMYAHVEFVTKLRGNVYEGQSLNFASGVDLSCNKLSGNIPPAIGNLSLIHSLNLSHNQLTGRIPSALSNLKSVESLDLSYNNLVGPIPAELVELTSLASFSVAHNNLSGKTPDLKAQFATFEENSYEGNPFLCGPPLKKNCSTSTTGPSYSTTRISDDDSSTHLVAFWASFAGAFVVGFIGIVVFLFINPYWEGIWFRMVRRWIFAVEYFLIDKFYKLKHLVCG
ncbi:hypothetical protein Sjap_009235 [Stephania japonica]|uniref:Uncharacterized protein n=1 Tax=Stephania japonica TaxID=461633 RepID=A0AAP0PF88_9MAGN